MSSQPGDQYPGNPSAEAFPTPEELGQMAEQGAQALAAQYPLNYDAVDMHMRALAGLYNDPLMDEDLHRGLPLAARDAAHEVADAAMKYFEQLGLKGEIMKELGAIDGRYTNADYEDALIGSMQLHVSIAARYEQSRRQTERYRHMARPLLEGPDAELWQELEDTDTAVGERRTGEFHYDEMGIRKVLEVFGRNFGIIAEGLAKVSPKNPQKLLGHAYSCLQAAQPRTH